MWADDSSKDLMFQVLMDEIFESLPQLAEGLCNKAFQQPQQPSGSM